MTTTEQEPTPDLAALQQLPEADREPEPLDPTCATTGVTATPNPLTYGDSEPAAESEPDQVS